MDSGFLLFCPSVYRPSSMSVVHVHHPPTSSIPAIVRKLLAAQDAAIFEDQQARELGPAVQPSQALLAAEYQHAFGCHLGLGGAGRYYGCGKHIGLGGSTRA